MTKTQFNVRLPDLTHQQLEEIADEYGLTKTQILILAIDRLKRELLPNENLMGELSIEEKDLVKNNN